MSTPRYAPEDTPARLPVGRVPMALVRDGDGRTALFAVLGVLQGIAVYVCGEYLNPSALRMALGFALAVCPLTFYLLWGEASGLRTALGIVWGIAVTALLYLALLRAGHGGDGLGHEVPAAALATLPVVPLLATVRTGLGGVEFFRRSSELTLAVLMAAAGTAIFIGVLSLIAALFHLIGIRLLADLLDETWFWTPLSIGFAALALGVLQDRTGLVSATRRLLVTLFQILAPVLAAGAVLFLCFLPFTGLDTLWETGFAAQLLMWIVVVGALFVVSVAEAATDRAPSRLAAIPMTVFALVMPAFAGLASFAIWLRVEQYGLTPDRVIAVAAAFVVALIALGSFGIVVWSRGVMTRWAPRGLHFAPVIATIAVVTALAVLSPFADPATLAARDQLARFRSGAVTLDTFDFGALKFAMGQPGLAALDAIRRNTDLPNRDAIEERLIQLDEAANLHEWQTLAPATGEGALTTLRKQLTLRPPAATAPDDLLMFLAGLGRHREGSCGAANRCILLEADLLPGGRAEWVLVERQIDGALTFDGIAAPEREWQVYDNWALRGDEADAVWQNLKDNQFRAAPASHKVLLVGPTTIPLAP